MLLVRHARFVLSEQSKAEDEIRQLGKEPSGEVRIGLPGTISEILTIPLIEAMTRKFPRIRLTISEAMSGFVAGWLRDGEIDLAILYVRPSDQSMESVKLLEEELLAFSAPQGLTGQAITLDELVTRPLILPSRAHGLRQMLDLACEEMAQVIQPVIEIDSYKNIKALVSRGLGVSILPHHAIAEDWRAGRLSAVPISPSMKRSAYLVSRANARPSRLVRIVRQVLEDVTLELIESGEWAGARRV